MGLFYQNSFSQKRAIDINDKAIKKTALIIGQSNYFYYDSLPNCVRDADGMTEALQRSGFSVSKYIDLNYGSMCFFIDQWRRSLSQYDVVLFYFSGHGVEVDGEDYLVPIDGKFYKSADVKQQCYKLKQLISSLDSCQHMADVILYDACRTQLTKEPQAQKDSVNYITAGNAFVGFASSPGDIVLSRPGDSLSVYTNAIIKNLGKQMTLDELFSIVKSEVALMTDQRQVPQKNNTLRVDICMGPAPTEE